MRTPEDHAVDLLVDYLAVARRGAATASAAAVRASLPAGGRADPSRVDGAGGRLSAENAAFVNGIAAHSLELDDTYEPGSVHPGVAVWPAVLALADEEGCEPDAILRAGIAGYDVTCALADRLGAARAYARGFHPTGVCGVVGAAAACADLLGLDEERTAHAVGIATSMAGGLLAYLADGAWTKRLHAGRAAEGGVRAARLAAAGFTGPRDPFEGEHGFLRAFGGDRAPGGEGAPSGSAVPGGEGGAPWIYRPRGHGVRATSFKLYPACRYAHGCADLLLGLDREDAVRVERVECAILSAGWTLVADPPERKRRIESVVDAQFSMPFLAALALSRGAVRLDDVERAPELAAELAPLMGRVQCVHDAGLDAAFPAAWGAAIRVTLDDGTERIARSADPFGSPASPAPPERLAAKVAELAGPEAAAALAALAAALRDGTAARATLAAARAAA